MFRSLFKSFRFLSQAPKSLLQPFSQPLSRYRFTSTSDPSTTKILEEVEAKIFHVLKSAAKCKVDKLSRTVSFEDLGFDSLDAVELVVAMEEHFNVDISNEEAEKIQTVGDAIAVFNKYLMEKINKTNVVEKKTEEAAVKKN